MDCSWGSRPQPVWSNQPRPTCNYHSKTLRGLIDTTRANDLNVIPITLPKGLAPAAAVCSPQLGGDPHVTHVPVDGSHNWSALQHRAAGE
jgi:hypothetical protein